MREERKAHQEIENERVRLVKERQHHANALEVLVAKGDGAGAARLTDGTLTAKRCWPTLRLGYRGKSNREMPHHKNQHFVPRCVLKSFSLNGEGKAINLYTFGKKLLVRNAPVKSQCARDYIYGAGGHVEHGLAQIEGSYRNALARVEKRAETVADLNELRFFAYLQLRRTEMAIQRMQRAEGALFVDTFGEDAAKEPSVEYFMVQSLKLCFETSPLIEDLKVRIIENNTDVDFVTSDDPAIMTNKFYTQKNLIEGGFGMGSSGLLLFMPLTPKLGVLCYDPLVYTLPDVAVGRLILKKSADAEALNELQYLKASAAIYFSPWETGDYVRGQFEKTQSRRITDWFVIKHAVFAKSDKDGDTFKEVTAEEAKTAARSIVHTYFKYPIPSRWLPQLKYRSPLKTFSNGTGIGHVRKEEWLRGFN
jgi:hypothetical protein